MKKLNLTMGCLLFASVLQAQVGTDPNLVGKDGNPVSVPSRSETRYNELGSNRMEVPKKEIPGTLRRNLDKEAYKGWEQSPIYLENSQYSVHLNNGDTTRIYFFDADGNPIRNTNKISIDPFPVNPADTASNTAAIPEVPADSTYNVEESND